MTATYTLIMLVALAIIELVLSDMSFFYGLAFAFAVALLGSLLLPVFWLLGPALVALQYCYFSWRKLTLLRLTAEARRRRGYLAVCLFAYQKNLQARLHH